MLPTTPTTEDDKGKKQEEQANTDLFPYEDIYAPEWQVGVVLIYFYSSFSFFSSLLLLLLSSLSVVWSKSSYYNLCCTGMSNKH